MKTYLQLTGAIALAALTGCSGIDSSSGALESARPLNPLCEAGSLGQAIAINSTGAVPEGCVKIEGDDIGKAGQSLEVGDGIGVEISAWQTKEGEANEFVGFTVAVTGGDVIFAVKAGGETYAGEGTTWVHPKGTKGSEASAISNVTFCPAPAEGEEGGEGEGEGGEQTPVEENPGQGSENDGNPDAPCENAGNGGDDDGTIDEGAGEGGEGEGHDDGAGGGSFPENPSAGEPGAQCSSDTECNEGLTCVEYRCSGGIN